MNICYIITSTNKCGPVNVLYNLLSNLNANEVRPYIITLRADENGKSRRKEFESLGIEVVQYNPQKQLSEIFSFIKDKQVKIVHSHGIIPDLVNRKISQRFGSIKCMTTLHNYPVEDYLMSHGKIKGSLMVALQLFAINKLNKIACSQAIQAKFRENLHIKTYAIENGVDFPLENEVINHYRDLPIFLYLGEINPRKNIEFLVDFFSNHPAYKLWIVGDGEGNYYHSIKDKVRNIHNITMWGRTETPEEFYKKADYVVSASYSEGLPMMVLEALSYGLPVILSDIPAHQETIINELCGSLYKLNDGQCLEKKIEQILADPPDRKKIYQLSKTKFSSDVMAENYVKFYKELVNGKHEINI